MFTHCPICFVPAGGCSHVKSKSQAKRLAIQLPADNKCDHENGLCYTQYGEPCTEPPAEEPQACLSPDGWRCSSCNEIASGLDPAWRWNGNRWEHKCPTQKMPAHEGHYAAKPPAAQGEGVDLDALERERDEAREDCKQAAGWLKLVRRQLEELQKENTAQAGEIERLQEEVIDIGAQRMSWKDKYKAAVKRAGGEEDPRLAPLQTKCDEQVKRMKKYRGEATQAKRQLEALRARHERLREAVDKFCDWNLVELLEAADKWCLGRDEQDGHAYRDELLYNLEALEAALRDEVD